MIGANASSCERLAGENRRVLKKVSFCLLLLLFLTVISPLTGTSGNHTQEEKNDIDGTISDGEYDFNVTIGNGDYSLYWRVIEDEIFFALRGKTADYEGKGFALIGPKGTKKTELFSELLQNPHTRLHSNDTVFVGGGALSRAIPRCPTDTVMSCSPI